MSNSDRPYKSRVLNFVNRQLMRFGDRAQTSLRQLKTATVWGVQLIAYPFYLLVQTSTIVGKQFQSKVVKLLVSAENAQTSVGSQPTTVVLSSLHPWLKTTPYELLSLPRTRSTFWEKLSFFRKKKSQPKFSPSDSPSPRLGLMTPLTRFSLNPMRKKAKTNPQDYLIQGLATHLETGKLVLVTMNNQAIDLFSETQHEQLQQRIKVVLECYEQMQQPWWWRLASQGNRGRFHPLHWLSKLMIWVQTSALAKRLNWFQESQLSFPNNEDHFSPKPLPPKPNLLQKLDRALSTWETTQLNPFLNKVKNWQQELEQTEPNHPVFSLIRAAIDYFYGAKPQKTLTGETNPPTATPNVPKILRPVYHLMQRGQGIVKSSFSRENLHEHQETDPFAIQRLIQAAINYFFGQTETSRLPTETEAETTNEPWLTKADLFNEAEIPKQLATETDPSPLATNHETPSEDNNPETDAESGSQWLQAEAVPVGYEKHILARILEWLDRALAWLERKLLKIWQWLKKRFNR